MLLTITSRTGFEKSTARSFKQGIRERIYRLMILGIAPFVTIPIPAVAQTITSFDVPNSTQTNATSINSYGAITGWYQSGPFVYAAFVREPQGAITTFGFPNAMSTSAASINSAGTIAGSYEDARAVHHGFIREPQGLMTTFDPLGSISTAVANISSAGAITGQFEDSRYIGHGFLRDSGGEIITFDPPGSLATLATSVNGSGNVAGYYWTASASHGFIRDPHGAFTTFDPPGSAEGTITSVTSIDESGAVTGYYSDRNGKPHAFVRNAQGAFAVFDEPGITSILSLSIAGAGASTGYYKDASSPYAVHSFLRDPQGTLITFDMPNSLDTDAQSINATGAIAGTWKDKENGVHGFVRQFAGQVNEQWMDGNKYWHDQNNTAYSYAPDAAAWTSLAGFYSANPNYPEHLFYLSADQHVHEQFSDSGGGWHDQDNTAYSRTSSVAAPGSSLTSFFASDPGSPEHVFYLTADQHVHEQWSDAGGGWHDQDNTKGSLAKTVAAVGSALTSFYRALSNSTEHLFYLDPSQHVHEQWLDSISHWHDQDNTAYSYAPPAAAGSALTSFYSPDPGSPEHAFYLDAVQHVHEQWSDSRGNWHDQDNTAYSYAPPAAAGSSLTSFHSPNPDFPEHVFYLDAEQHIHEQFSDSGGRWHDQDNTWYADAPSAAAGSALTSFYSPDPSSPEHVFYTTPDQHVHELSSDSGGGWHDRDNTFYSDSPPALMGTSLSAFYRPTGNTAEHLFFLTPQ